MKELRSIARRSRREQLTRPKPGQAIVEMAFVIIMLLMLTLGVIDAGLFMYRYVQAANCTREAARRASVWDPNPTAVSYCIDNTLSNISLNYPEGQEPGKPVTASLTVTYNSIIIGYISPLPDTITIQSDTTMRLEGKKVGG